MSAEAGGPDQVTGERGTTLVNRSVSVQSRISNILALSLMTVLGLGALIWYYAGNAARQNRARSDVQRAASSHAAGDTVLPSLGRIDPPAPPPQISPVMEGGAASEPGVDRVSLDANTLPEIPLTGNGAYAASAPPTPEQLAQQRQLSGAVFSNAAVPSAGPPMEASAQPGSSAPPAAQPVSPSADLPSLLRSTPVAAVRAEVLPAQRLLLPKGAFIDCTLETAIDSTLPGMTTCVMATDVFGVDGKVVLLERGTKLIGETRGQVQQGQARIFVLWTEARTPAGVVVPLASPGADELGRAGLPGEVNRHFWERFGAAMLISVIGGAVESASSRNGTGTVIVDPSTSQGVMTEVLKGTINIPPTITKQNGDRIPYWSREMWTSGRCMSCAPPIERAEESSALALTMRALRPLLADREVTELCINRPREAFVESRGGWQRRGTAFRGLRMVQPAREAHCQLDPAARRLHGAALCLRPCRPASACRWCCRRRPRPAVSPSRSADPPTQCGASMSWRSAASSGAPAGRQSLDDAEKELLRLLAAGDYAAFMRLAVAARKNILVSGPTGSGKTTWTKALIREISPRRAPDHHRGRAGTGARPPSESRAPVLLERRPGRRESNAEAAARVLLAHEARPDPAGRAALRGGLRLPAQRQLRPSGLDYEHTRRERRSRLRAIGAAGEAESGRSRARTRGHQESALSLDRRRDPVRRRGARTLHQGDLVRARAQASRRSSAGRSCLMPANRSCTAGRASSSATRLSSCRWSRGSCGGAARGIDSLHRLSWLPPSRPCRRRGEHLDAAAFVPGQRTRRRRIRTRDFHCSALLGYAGGRSLANDAPPADSHRRGAVVAERSAVVRPSGRHSDVAITVAGRAVPSRTRAKHFKLIGTTGTGKSTAIREILSAALARGDRAVIADPDGGYLRRFFDASRGDTILNPFDERSVRWDLFAEIKTPYDVEQLARSLIPDHEGSDRSWRGYARTFLSASLARRMKPE